MNAHDLFVDIKYKEVAELIPKKSKVLDLGCKDGELRSYLQGREYYGADVNKEFIDKLARQGIKVEQADFNSTLPFKKEKFDFILMLDLLEHLVNPADFLIKARKLLNKNGKIIITLPNDYHLLNKLRFIFNKPLTSDPFSYKGHFHIFPIKFADKLIQKDFKIIKKVYLPGTKPLLIPQFVKNLLTRISPNNFSRGVLYLIS